MLEGRSGSSRDLIGLVKQQVTPQAIEAVAAQLGEDRERTASAVSTSVPSVLAALSDVADTDRGAAHLKAAIEAKASPAARSATMSLLGGGGTGRDDSLLDEELGRRSWAISDDVARASGIGRESAHKLLGGVTSVALLALAKTGTATNPAALRALLHEQSLRGETVYTAPEHEVTGPAIRRIETPRRRSGWLLLAGLILAALIAIPLVRGIMKNRAPSPPPEPAATEPQTQAPTPAPTPQEAAPANEPAAGVPAEEPQAAAPAPAAAPTEAQGEQGAAPSGTEGQGAAPAEPQGAAPSGAEGMQGAAPAEQPQAAAPAAGEGAAPAEQPQAAAPTPAPAEEPGAQPTPEPTFPAGSPVSEMASFLGSDEGSTPRTFRMDDLTFRAGSSEPSPVATETVDQLAEALRAYPTSEITLDSFTDSRGSASFNESLSEDRSEAVKEMLVARGVDESRISTAGHGESDPLDTNATAEGRAANRRTEVTVTSR
jgi:outer membrane protein OmpA-like peptidoglycan-associated protein